MKRSLTDIGRAEATAQRRRRHSGLVKAGLFLWIAMSTAIVHGQLLDRASLARIRQAEAQRVAAIDSVIGSVVAIYDWDRQGGGSGVIIDPSGIAVTNHHVIMGAGVQGLGGLADGNLYEWDLIGSDPGGDVAVIQLRGQSEFPVARWGDSDRVRVGDWAMAMGNPFVLSEDHAPTITLGIVSGVQRFQAGAGQNELVYGNCIQIDSSINPGNSGGPLFNRFGEIIGINGRASFLDRGRVNVGLGYAISSNQVINFLPDLLATKLARHGTLDASFGTRGGKVVCTSINQDAPIALAGLELADELIEFEGVAIQSANQYLNLICTLPEGWPVSLKVRKADGQQKQLVVRLLGLPYQRPPQPAVEERPDQPPDQPPDPRQQRQQALQQEMMALLSGEQGRIRKPDVNRQFVDWLWREVSSHQQTAVAPAAISWSCEFFKDREKIGTSTTTLWRDGNWKTTWTMGNDSQEFMFDGHAGFFQRRDDAWIPLTLSESKLQPAVITAWGIMVANSPEKSQSFGEPLIDGSDKAAGSPAFRVRFVDTDRDWFFTWITGFGPQPAGQAMRVTKVSPDQDCDGATGGIVYADWQSHEGWLLPTKMRQVSTLGELESSVAQLSDWELVDEPFDSESQPAFPSQEIPVSQHAGRGDLQDSAESSAGSPAAVQDSQGALGLVIAANQARMVKVFGAGVGRVEGYSSGILISDDGLVVTAQGVFLEGSQVSVVLADGRSFPATVLKRDRTVQLALLKIETETPEYFELSRDDVGNPGDWVVALSNAFRVADKDEPLSAMLGVISLRTSIDARLSERDVAYRGDLVLIDAITSNPGAAGGAVVTLNGQLVGVIGKIINSSETNTRLNYAIPARIVAAFVSGDLSAQTVEASPKGMADLGIQLFELGGRRNPAYVDRIVPDGPAADAGLKTDDMIVTLAGAKIGSVREYEEALEKLQPHQEVVIIVKRGVEMLRLNITPRERQ